MALELNKSDILGRPINVERYQVKKLGTGKNRHFKGGRPVNAPPTKAGKQNGKPNKQNDKVSPKKEKTLFSGVKTNDAKKVNLYETIIFIHLILIVFCICICSKTRRSQPEDQNCWPKK